MMQPHFRGRRTPDGEMVTYHTPENPQGETLDCLRFGFGRWNFRAEAVAASALKILGVEVSAPVRLQLENVFSSKFADGYWTLTVEDVQTLLDGKADDEWWSRVVPPPF